LFNALNNTVTAIGHNIKDKEVRKYIGRSELMKVLFPEDITEEKAVETISNIVFRSWEFMLSKDKQHVRYWRYQNSRQILKLFKDIEETGQVSNPLAVIQKLIYKSGNNYIDTRREDFSRSLLMGKPEIGILEEAVWEIMSHDGIVKKDILDLATFLVKTKIEGTEMERDEILKQCKMIGWTIAKLSIEDSNKGMLYELRSVGNPQSFRSFIERLTFSCALRGRSSYISDDFITKLFEGDEWKSYKSIIAIVANQQFSNLTPKKEVPAQ
ncbi:MAG: hypothetical protein QXU18_12930, partial [Thermoplasmatales archaeon]